MFNIKPKDELFFDLFVQGAQISHKAAKELRTLMNELDNSSNRIELLTKLENQGDTITHNLIEHTKKMFITPLDREDIFNITKEIDNVTDNIEAAAHRFYMYDINEPTHEAIEMIDKLVAATADLEIIVTELKTLSKSNIMLDKIINVNKIENEADQIYRRAVRKLFQNPEDVLYVIRWKDLYKYIEDSIDSCEKLANDIRGVVMKYA